MPLPAAALRFLESGSGSLGWIPPGEPGLARKPGAGVVGASLGKQGVQGGLEPGTSVGIWVGFP